MNFSEHLSAARTVLAEFASFIETNSTLHAYSYSILPYEKVVVKNAIIISALEDRSDANIDFCRTAFHMLSMTVDDLDANFINQYFATLTKGDVDAVDSLDVARWNKLRAKIHQEFAAYETEMRVLLNQVAMFA